MCVHALDWKTNLSVIKNTSCPPDCATLTEQRPLWLQVVAAKESDRFDWLSPDTLKTQSHSGDWCISLQTFSQNLLGFVTKLKRFFNVCTQLFAIKVQFLGNVDG